MSDWKPNSNKATLRAALEARGIEEPEDARNKDLVELLKAHDAAAARDHEDDQKGEASGSASPADPAEGSDGGSEATVDDDAGDESSTRDEDLATTAQMDDDGFSDALKTGGATHEPREPIDVELGEEAVLVAEDESGDRHDLEPGHFNDVEAANKAWARGELVPLDSRGNEIPHRGRVVLPKHGHAHGTAASYTETGGIRVELDGHYKDLRGNKHTVLTVRPGSCRVAGGA